MKKKKCILSLLLVVCLVAGLMPTMAAAAEGDVTYLYCDENGANWQTGTKTSSEYTLVTPNDTAWGVADTTTWYYASGDITISSRVTINGTVNLILENDCNLIINGGIGVNNQNNFSIFAQSTEQDTMGKLTAKATSGWYAGIGGQDGIAYGNITINGGNIIASGNVSSAGIGAGHRAGGNTITINGGYVTATTGASTYEPPAISCCGAWGGAGSIIINGGVVNANGCGKGIGWSTNARGTGSIQITGGVITANGIGVGNYGETLDNTYISGNAVVISNVNTTNQSTWNGIINYVMYGTSVTPTEDFTIPSGKTLTIESGKTLMINDSIIVEAGGTLNGDGTIDLSGGGTIIGAVSDTIKLVYGVDATGLVNIASDGAEMANNKENYTATLTANNGYTLPDSITVTIGGTEYTTHGYTAQNPTLTIQKENIKGNIVIAATATDITAPNLTAVNAARTDQANAMVKFKSSEAGIYYYSVVENGSSTPTIDTSAAGTACVNGENAINLTNLTVGAKDIYIVVKDAAGNVSSPLKMEVPAYLEPSDEPITPTDPPDRSDNSTATGDDTDLLPWIIMAAAAVMVGIGTLVSRRRIKP